jgi:hypothetical protein
MKTGDLLLFSYNGGGFFGCFTECIKKCTHSKFSHIGMIIKDPTFIDPTLKGIYVWESSWNGTPDPQDGKIKLGVQLTHIEKLINEYKKTNSQIYLREVNYSENPFQTKTLKEIHDTVYDKPYDIVPLDWIEALFRLDTEPQKTSRFWCSALVGYIYTKCGILDINTDWSVLRASDFSVSQEHLKFNKGFSLENQHRIV